jgi:hypothetical protein
LPLKALVQEKQLMIILLNRFTKLTILTIKIDNRHQRLYLRQFKEQITLSFFTRRFLILLIQFNNITFIIRYYAQIIITSAKLIGIYTQFYHDTNGYDYMM